MSAIVRRSAPRLLALCLFCWLARPTSAAAQGVSPESANDAQRDEASESFRSGRTAFDERRFSDALDGFRASYKVVASPNTHLMIGHSLRELGRLAEAYETFEQVGREADRAAVENAKYEETARLAREEQERLRSKIALLTLTLPPTGPDASLTVGGRSVPPDRWDQPIAVEPGKVVVVLNDAGAPVVESLEATAGGTAALDLSPRPVEPPEEESSAEMSWTGTQRYVAYAVAGLGVLSLATSAGTGGASLSQHGELEEACGDLPCPERQDDIDRGRALQTASNVTLVIGLVALGAGVTIFLTAPDEERKSSGDELEAQLELGPGSLSLRGRF